MKYVSILRPMKIMSDLNISFGKMSDFVSFPLFRFTLVIKLRNFAFESYWNTLICFDRKRPQIWICHMEKKSDFVSFPLVKFTLAMKLRSSEFESHWNTLIHFDIKKDVLSDLNMSHGRMSEFVSFPLLSFTLVIKLRNFDFRDH